MMSCACGRTSAGDSRAWRLPALRPEGAICRGGRDRLFEIRFAALVDLVPDRDRDAEVALPRHAPVLAEPERPVPETGAHVLGAPLELRALLQQLGLLVEQPHEPLPSGQELERALALLEELDRMLDLLR